MTKIDISGLSVLLVDDVTFSLETVTRQMAGLGLQKIYHAKNGQQGLGVLRNPETDVKFVISDFNMPVMHGLEFLKEIRCGKAGVGRATPFAMLTGYSEKHLVNLALALDVNAFLIKPISKAGLEARISKMLVQAISEPWLKSEDVYKAVNVDSALDGIRMPETDPEASAPRRVFIDPRSASAAKEKAREASSSGKGEHQVELNAVPENAVLTRDICSDTGRLLLASGSKLTPRVVSVLVDLKQLGHPTGKLWVVED